MTTYDFVASNKRKTAGLIIVFLAFILALGWVIDRAYNAGGGFIVLAGAYSSVTALVSYFSGDKIALLATGARQVTETDNPYVVRMVDNLCITTGMPKPKVYIIEDQAINAFATGRDPNHASIAVTTGAIEKLANEELEGVLAHELSHIKNYDIRLMTVVIVLVGTVVILSDLVFRSSFFFGRRSRDREGGSGLLMIVGLLMLILAPIIAQLIKLAVSRKREFLADASGALITRFPEGLARALQKIAGDNRPMARASAATAHLFFANPFSGRALANLFSTHPPIEDRIKALTQMSAPA
jgi:heat shock protein HtpX